MRAVLLSLVTLALFFVPLPVTAQLPDAAADLPVQSLPEVQSLPKLPDPSEPGAFVAQHKGALYEAKGDAVRRLDGLKVGSDEARQVVKAKRVHDLLASRPDLVERLAEREAASGELLVAASEADALVAKVKSVAAELGLADAESLSGLLASLPVRPVDLLDEVGGVRSKVAGLHGQAPQLSAASGSARGALHAFDLSHDVADKRALVDSFASAVPIYEDAAARADSVAGHAERVVSLLESDVAALEARSDGLLSGLLAGASVPADLSAAAADLLALAAALESYADALRADAEFLRSVASEPAEPNHVVEWVVGGGAGVAGAGLGSLWWLRRRAGLP